jgi:seryl-tRNA synthetase
MSNSFPVVNVSGTDSMQGFIVPEPLRKYIPGAPEFLPYTKELPKDSTSTKTRSKPTTKSASGADEVSRNLKDMQL